MIGQFKLPTANIGGPMMSGMFAGGAAPAGNSGGLLGELSQPQQLNRGMVMPSGGPNMHTQLPTSGGPMPEMGGPMAEPTDPIVRAMCGLPPVSTNGPSGSGGFVKPTFGGGDNPSPTLQQAPLADLFNRPMPSFGGGMAPSVPQPVDFGLGGQQMGFGNGMGNMNNWFSNFTAPRPPAMAAPAPMMPMKGMFGIR